MPWAPGDAQEHTKAADTPHKQEAWAKAANDALRRNLSEGAAIRLANDVVNRMGGSSA